MFGMNLYVQRPLGDESQRDCHCSVRISSESDFVMPLLVLITDSMCKCNGGVPESTWRALVDTVL